ncbi:hypothetical protein EYF80_065290 [Liparis tanakae]|uniref:Uncharacterized protein n=1 Tax=Liparis tanakae TaxID=230148 RepID=A0A4Z2E730_9TELE|nr:hypothetical protein EYF80_065290 [Liparis tanakae]
MSSIGSFFTVSASASVWRTSSEPWVLMMSSSRLLNASMGSEEEEEEEEEEEQGEGGGEGGASPSGVLAAPSGRGGVGSSAAVSGVSILRALGTRVFINISC